MSILQKPVCAVVDGRAASPEAAGEIVQLREKCPYVASIEADGNRVTSVYVIPFEQQWWLEIVQEVPELLGLVTASVSLSDEVTVSSPWSRGVVYATEDSPPCGADCRRCLHLGRRCGGCPAYIFSKAP